MSYETIFSTYLALIDSCFTKVNLLYFPSMHMSHALSGVIILDNTSTKFIVSTCLDF